MGWMYVLGECWSCGRLFGFNAERVPSIRVQGERQPVCRHCMERANMRRVAAGLEPLEILPGAYDPSEESS